MDLKLAGNDVSIGANNDLELVDGTDAIAQDMQSRFRMFRGEWFLNPLEGVPYYDQVFIKNPRLSIVNALLTRVAAETEGVATIVSFTSVFDKSLRRFSVSLTARTDEGATLTFKDFVL